MAEQDPPLNTRYQSWVWTQFDVSSPPVFNSDVMHYLCWGPEICPETQRPHLQGYVFFHSNKRQTLKGCVRHLTQGVHVEKAQGTPEQAMIYCKGPWTSFDKKKSKPLNSAFVEFGEMPIQGKRTDLLILKNKLLSGVTTVDAILEEEPTTYHTYGRTLLALNSLKERKMAPRSFKPHVVWNFGETETGKTHDVIKFIRENKLTYYKYKFTDKDWQDGYSGQDVLWIDELKGQIPYGELLDITGENEHQFARRSVGPINNVSKYIFITSSKAPFDIYKHQKDDSFMQLTRRITELRQYLFYDTGPGYEVIDHKSVLVTRKQHKKDGSAALETLRRLREVLGSTEDYSDDIVGDAPEDERPARKRFCPAYS